MAIYTITFSWLGKSEIHTFQCPDDLNLLDAAEENGHDWLYGNRYGGDAEALARLVSGKVDQSDQGSLDDYHLDYGYILSDVAYPRSDCMLVVGVKSEFDYPW